MSQIKCKSVANFAARYMDSTVTAMGGRLLRRWLNRPLRDHREILARYDAIEQLIEGLGYEPLRDAMRGTADIERILARIALRSARPRDLTGLRATLAQLPVLSDLLSIRTERLAELGKRLAEQPEMLDLLQRAIIEQPPVLIRDGGVIAEGFDEQLDELRGLSENADQFLLDLEQREREATGIANLKVSYNRVHGYYIEISKGQSNHAPERYIRRQTLKGAERYITPELKAFEDKVLSARERALSREKALYEQLLDTLAEHMQPLQDCAEALAQLDVLCALAERASALDYVRPQLVTEPALNIEAGRHPVVEQVSEEPFIPNDIRLDDERRMLIITGPNMGGKSTYMRQVALITLMAHVGCFVPAGAVTLGPIDRIFTRIGASDDLAGGRSTFMVEMTETANILHNASRESLVLLDEIGRGTSTFDGMSLAWSAAAHLAGKVGAFTLFATHYFELTTLPEQFPGIANVHLDAVEHGHRIVFMHTVKEGPANQSYGLQVAALAGIPKPVIDAARGKLRQLEEESARKESGPQDQLGLFEAEADSPALDRLKEISPDDLSPKQALELLYELKELVNR